MRQLDLAQLIATWTDRSAASLPSRPDERSNFSPPLYPLLDGFFGQLGYISRGRPWIIIIIVFFLARDIERRGLVLIASCDVF